MSLKNDYFQGKTGLLAQMDAAFAAGVAYVGSAIVQIDNLSFGNVNGAALATGTTGLYFDTSSPSVSYRVWFNTGGESAPSAGSAVLVPVSVLAGDSPVQVASKAAAAVNLIAGQPIIAASDEEVLVLANVIVGPGLLPTSVGTLGGTSYVDHVQVGVAANGNYAALQGALVANAAAGLTHFIVTLPVSYQPQYLRGSRGNHFCVPNQTTPDPNFYSVAASNSNYGNDPSDNLIRKSFFAGVQQGLADNQIYNFECSLKLNTSDQLNLAVDFIFMFQTK
jgi:hypothetical protein